MSKTLHSLVLPCWGSPQRRCRVARQTGPKMRSRDTFPESLLSALSKEPVRAFGALMELSLGRAALKKSLEAVGSLRVAGANASLDCAARRGGPALALAIANLIRLVAWLALRWLIAKETVPADIAGS